MTKPTYTIKTDKFGGWRIYRNSREMVGVFATRAAAEKHRDFLMGNQSRILIKIHNHATNKYYHGGYSIDSWQKVQRHIAHTTQQTIESLAFPEDPQELYITAGTFEIEIFVIE